MNWLDILIIVAICISVAIGVLRGFVRECFSLASYIIAYLTAMGTYALFSQHLGGIIKHPQGREIVAFAFIFIIVVILVNLIGRLLRKLISKAKGLSFFDRMVGLVFGFARGVLILALLMIPVSLFPVIGSESVRNSRMAPYLVVVSRELSRWAFSDKNIFESGKLMIQYYSIKEDIGDGFDTIKQVTKDAKEKVTEKIGGNKKDPPEKDSKARGDDKTGITKNDREKLNRLLEKL